MKNVERVNKSPLRYPGGKTRACKIIENTLCVCGLKLENYKTLVSPFFGGGSFEFYISNKHGLSIKANDKFRPLINFWQHAKSEKSELVAKLRNLHPTTKEQFMKYRQGIIESFEDNLLASAAHFFVINRCSFSGATFSGGFSQESSKKRFTKSSIDRVAALDLEMCEFDNKDFTDFIAGIKTLPDYLDGNAIMFCDPPYFLEKGNKLYGKKGDLHENFNHVALASALKECNPWILCYNDCPKIRELYADFNIVELKWSYGMNKTKKSSEILILNV